MRRDQRAEQVFAWLCENFPHTIKPVRLRFTKAKTPAYKGKPWWGWVEDGGRHLTLTISLRRCQTWDMVLDTLLHEYAHCLDAAWHPRIEKATGLREHPHTWGCHYSDLYDAVITDGGLEESKGY